MSRTYVLIGGIILGGYFLIYLLRIRRSRRMEEYMNALSKAKENVEQLPEIPGVTREMVQDEDNVI